MALYNLRLFSFVTRGLDPRVPFFSAGSLAITLRHGPVPPGRRMFDVPADEVIGQAATHGLQLLHHSERGDMFSRGNVRWDVLMLERPG